MAENGAERTEQATPKRLEEARKKGQVPRSRELSHGGGVHRGGASLSTRSAADRGRQFAELMRGALALSRRRRRSMRRRSMSGARHCGAPMRSWIVAADPRRARSSRRCVAPLAHRRLELLRPGD